VLRARSKRHGEDSLSDEKESNDGSSEVELRLTSAMDTILRYQTSLKRDLYRAIQMLHALQDMDAPRRRTSRIRRPSVTELNTKL
jgi:hypothetical protein